MRPLAEVQAEILAAVPTLGATRVPLGEALHLVLAEPVVAKESVPPFANTAMDGYAVRAADTDGATTESADPAVRRRRSAGRSGADRRRGCRARRSGS